MRLNDANPFILLDDARPDGAPARLYADPVEVVAAQQPDEVGSALERLRRAQAKGLHAAGFLAYGAGHAIEPAMPASDSDGMPLLWFGLFERWREIAAEAVADLLPDAAGAWAGAPEPEIDLAAYRVKAARVAEHIRAGDIYQANLTFRAAVPTLGDPLALYAAIRQRARAGYGGIIATGNAVLLSFSPELFFALESGRLTALPMKGTATRGETAQADALAAAALRDDPKQRAENLMIVDLIRNDLSRVAKPGTVRVPERFVVETYPTVHQMTSRVEAELREGHDAIDALAALFPCGSITGAPKIRAMQIIAKVEDSPRGPYCGAIGRIDGNGDAMFNVAIRTLWRKGGSPFRIGLGSGYVADSVPDGEWAECIAKGAFVTAGQRPFDLIETMAFDPRTGIALLERHLSRMKESARTFGFAFDRHAARNDLQAATFRLRAASRIRLLLSRTGNIAIEIGALPPAPREPVPVTLAPLPVAPDDFRLLHKTTDRAFYDSARKAGGAFETLFVRPDGLVSEGSFSSVFVPRGEVLATPKAGIGLPGVLRAELIETGRAVEEDVTAADLTQEFFIGNAVRGLIRARLVADDAADR